MKYILGPMLLILSFIAACGRPPAPVSKYQVIDVINHDKNTHAFQVTVPADLTGPGFQAPVDVVLRYGHDGVGVPYPHISILIGFDLPQNLPVATAPFGPVLIINGEERWDGLMKTTSIRSERKSAADPGTYTWLSSIWAADLRSIAASKSACIQLANLTLTFDPSASVLFNEFLDRLGQPPLDPPKAFESKIVRHNSTSGPKYSTVAYQLAVKIRSSGRASFTRGTAEVTCGYPGLQAPRDNKPLPLVLTLDADCVPSGDSVELEIRIDGAVPFTAAAKVKAPYSLRGEGPYMSPTVAETALPPSVLRSISLSKANVEMHLGDMRIEFEEDARLSLGKFLDEAGQP